MPTSLPPGSHVTRLVQKTVLFNGDCLALWAGRDTFALAAIKAISEAFAGGTRQSLLGTLADAGFERQHLDEIELIVFRGGRTNLTQYLLHVHVEKHRGADIVRGGSGAWHAIDDVLDIHLNGERETFERLFFDRAASAIISDLMFRDNYTFSYGGWFEFARRETGSFLKVPYAVKLWGVDAENVFDGPIFISGYREHDLLIFYYNRYEQYVRPPTYIPDFLRRSERTTWDGYPPDRPHEIEFHIVHFYHLSQTYYFVLGPDQLSIEANISKSDLRVSMNPKSFNLFLADVRAGKKRGYPVCRTSDPA